MDLDDAIWLERLPDGWNAVVSISAVSEAVIQNSYTDLSARRRGATRYRGTRTVTPMLDYSLSQGSLSLLPDTEREVLAFTINLSQSLEVRDVRLERTTLNNRGRYDHREAGVLSRSGDGVQGAMLGDMFRVAGGLLQQRRSGGAIAFMSENGNVLTDEEGNRISYEGSDEARAHLIVQEFMILVNRTISALCAKAGVGLIYRNHTEISREEPDIADDETEDGEARKNGRAFLSPVPEGHAGLNLPAYAWFTSPVRRYADLVNHRILLSILDGYESPYSRQELDSIARELNDLDALEKTAVTDGFKDAARERALFSLQDGRLCTLNRARMTGVIKVACETPNLMHEEFVSVITERMKQCTLSSKDMSRLLMCGNLRVRDAVLDYLAAEPDMSSLMLSHMFQNGKTESPVSSAGNGFRLMSAVMNGVKYTGEPIRGNGPMAYKFACVSLLMKMSESRRAVKTDAAMNGSQEIPANTKGDVIGICASAGWEEPAVTVQTFGPKHSPFFMACVTVKAGDKTLCSAEHRGMSRKQAERNAFGEMLEMLHGIRKTIPGTIDTDEPNARGKLIDVCNKIGLGSPMLVTKHSGPMNKPLFVCTVTVTSENGILENSGNGRTRKAAEREACSLLLVDIENNLSVQNFKP